MNYLLTENDALYSRFLIFFLSCTNLKKFYQKKEKEFNPVSWEKWLKSQSNTYTSVPEAHHGSKRDSLKEPPKTLDMKPNESESSETKLHLFLEEVYPHIISNSKQYQKATVVVEDLKTHLKQVSTDLKRLGEIYSDLFQSFGEIEKSNRPEIAQISPSVSGLYHGLKQSMFQLSNTFEQHLNNFKRFFEKNMSELNHSSEALAKVAATHLTKSDCRNSLRSTEAICLQHPEVEVEQGASIHRHRRLV